MKNSTFMNEFNVHRQQSLRVASLNHRIFIELDLEIVWQWRLSFQYTLLIRFFRLISWSAWLEELFNDNRWWIMLVIVKEQWALMMSEYRSFKMKFYVFHLRHDLHICSLISCTLFVKHSFDKDLVRIKMSLVREINILSKWVHRLDYMTMIILHSQLLIF
jgi:hypothetical protein